MGHSDPSQQVASENRKVDAAASFAFQSIKMGFGEALARAFLLVDYHLKDRETGVADIERDRLDFPDRDRLEAEFELASGA
jgi:hypothetical protein